MNFINLYSSLIQCISDHREALGLVVDEKRLAYHAALCLLSDAELTAEEFAAMDEMVLSLVLDRKLISENGEPLEFGDEPIANVFFLLSHTDDDSFPPSEERIAELKIEIDSLRANYSQEYSDLAYSLLSQDKTEEDLLGEFKKVDELFEN